MRIKRQRDNYRGRIKNGNWFVKFLRSLDTEEAQIYEKIKGMTNWQNHQWLRAGCPGSLQGVTSFASLSKPKNFAMGLGHPAL